MPQLVFKKRLQDDVYEALQYMGEYDSTNVVIPRVGENVIFTNTSNISVAYKVVAIEHVYAVVFGVMKLYHVLIYIEDSKFLDEKRYFRPRRSSSRKTA